MGQLVPRHCVDVGKRAQLPSLLVVHCRVALYRGTRGAIYASSGLPARSFIPVLTVYERLRESLSLELVDDWPGLVRTDRKGCIS